MNAEPHAKNSDTPTSKITRHGLPVVGCIALLGFSFIPHNRPNPIVVALLIFVFVILSVNLISMVKFLVEESRREKEKHDREHNKPSR